MKKIMGIDYGDARTGVAVSDLLCSIVGTTTVIPSRNADKALADLVRMASEQDVGTIVVGLPRNMDGSEGFRADRCREFAGLLRERLENIPIAMMDERMTTMSASRYLNETNTTGQKRKGVIDTLSAQIILQNALDRLKN